MDLHKHLKEEWMQMEKELLTEKQGVPKGVDPEKHERCVKSVKKDSDVDNPYAVCNASLQKEGKMSDLDIAAEEIAERFQQESNGDEKVMEMLMNAVHEKLGIFEESTGAVAVGGGTTTDGVANFKAPVGKVKKRVGYTEEELAKLRESLTEEDKVKLDEYGALSQWVGNLIDKSRTRQGLTRAKDPLDVHGRAGQTGKNYRGASFGAYD